MNKAGLIGWIAQRVSAVVMVVFLLAMLAPCAFRSTDAVFWQQYLMHPLMILLTVITFIALCIHAWLGMAMIISDYLPQPGRQKVLYLVAGSLLVYGVAFVSIYLSLVIS